MSLDLDAASSPYGSYAFDVKSSAQQLDDSTELESKCLHSSSGVSLWLYKDYVLKDYLLPDDFLSDTDPNVLMIIRARSDLKRVLKVISAAGDCSVPVIGRRFNGDQIHSSVLHL